MKVKITGNYNIEDKYVKNLEEELLSEGYEASIVEELAIKMLLKEDLYNIIDIENIEL